MKSAFQAALITLFSSIGGIAFAETSLPQCGVFPDNAKTYECACPAIRSNGTVWGSGPYTADSDVCEAARHAGAIGAGGGPILVVQADGMASYAGSASNGVTTRDWGSYGVSFMVVSLRPAETCEGFNASASPLNCFCPAGGASGAVWGISPFTGDSDICTAARFEGVIGPDGGMVRLLAVDGLESYAGDSNNGITTASWGSYSESFVFDWNMR